MDGMLMKD